MENANTNCNNAGEAACCLCTCVFVVFITVYTVNDDSFCSAQYACMAACFCEPSVVVRVAVEAGARNSVAQSV